MELPRDAAKLVLWFKGLQQPTGFLVLRADAEVAHIQMLMGKTDEALASYQRLILLGDVNNPKLRPLIEAAFETATPLLLETKRYQDVLENCEFYARQFPEGALMAKARQWRDEAQRQMAMSAAPAPGPAP